MEQLEQGRAPDTSGWYIIAADRVKVVPVRPGMTIGETESGELSVDRAHAQLELDIGRDSSLVVRALGNIQLASSEEANGQTDCVTSSRSVEISLSQSSLLIDTKFVRFTPSKRPLRFTAVYPPDDEIVADALAEPIEPVNSPSTGSAGFMPPPERVSETSDPLPVNMRFDQLDSQRPFHGRKPQSGLRRMRDRSETRMTRRLARLSLTQKALVSAVAIIALVLGVLTFFSSAPTVAPGDTDVVLQSVDPEDSEASAARPGQLSDAERNPDTVSVSTPTTPVETIEQTSDAAPDTGDIFQSTDENQLTVVASEVELNQPLSDQEIATSGTTTPQQTPPQQTLPQETLPQESLPQEVAPEEVVSGTPVLKELVTQELPSNETNQSDDSPPAPVEPVSAPVARERSALAERVERASAQQRAIERDLLAADVALEEGRLMTPEETSALTLYSRVLSLDPDSPDALRGMASVREQLINLAFAQLASGDWNLVSVTLDAAEKAGASPDLVSDLRSEAGYQLRLARARAGQFDALYPAQQLKAVAQERPRLSRWRTSEYQQVDVEFTVTVRGDVRDVQILDNLPPRLADTIGRTVETWRFEPVLENGRPVPVRTRMIIDVGS